LIGLQQDAKRAAQTIAQRNFIEKMKVEFENFRKKFPQKAIMSIKSEKVSGNWFLNSKNVTQSFDCEGVKDGKYLFMVFAFAGDSTINNFITH